MSIQELIKERTKLSEQESHILAIYLKELWKWNQKINLVGVSSIERVIEELLLDSLMAKEFLPEEGTLLDIGSGAGFPSIPLKVIKQEIIFHLIEAKTKKAAFLRHVIKKMGLKDIHVMKGRIENLKEDLLPAYDVITFRGIKLISGLILARPYLSNGIIISFQGSNFKSALNEAKTFMEKNMLRIVKINEYSISKGKRALVLFERS